MSEVKRYTPYHMGENNGDVCATDVVRYSDYAALEAENARLKGDAVDTKEHLEEYHTDLSQMRKEREAFQQQLLEAQKVIERLKAPVSDGEYASHVDLATANANIIVTNRIIAARSEPSKCGQ